MTNPTNFNEIINPEEKATNRLFNGASGIIRETGDYAKKNKLTPCLSFSLYCIASYFMIVLLLFVFVKNFIEKMIGLIACTSVIIFIIVYTFNIHKEEIKIAHRNRKNLK